MLFNEPKLLKFHEYVWEDNLDEDVSVLFNEPKLLKSVDELLTDEARAGFSALQRAEIAEIGRARPQTTSASGFQCSSTSRNC